MARYRVIRTDFHEHPKMRGLSPLARDLLLQCLEEGITGVMCRSPARMARAAGGGTKAKDVEAAIGELEQRGIVRWWPDIETLWWIEAADEQCKNDKAWIAARSSLLNAPIEVRQAFATRYPDRCPSDWCRVRDSLCQSPDPSGGVGGNTLSQARTAEDYRVRDSLFHQDQDQDQDQDQETGECVSGAEPPSPRTLTADERRMARARELWLWYEELRLRKLPGSVRRRPDEKKLTSACRKILALAKHIRSTEGLDEEQAFTRIEAYASESLDEAAADPDNAGYRSDWNEWRPTRFDNWVAFRGRRKRAVTRGPVDPSTQDHKAEVPF